MSNMLNKKLHWYDSMRSIPAPGSPRNSAPSTPRGATSKLSAATPTTSPTNTQRPAVSAATSSKKPATSLSPRKASGGGGGSTATAGGGIKTVATPTVPVGRLTKDTKLSARRRRMSLTSLSSLSSAKATNAAIKELAETHAGNSPSEPPRAQAASENATGRRRRGSSFDTPTLHMPNSHTAHDDAGDSSMAVKLASTRGDRVATLHAYLEAMDRKRAKAGGTASSQRGRGVRSPATPTGSTTASASPSASRAAHIGRRRGGRRRNTVAPRSAAARSFLHRNRPSTLAMVHPIVVGGTQSLYADSEPAIVNKSNVIKAIAAVEARLVELLLVHKEQERRDSAALGRRQTDARFLSLVANLHAGVVRKKPKSPRLQGDQVPSMLSKSLVSVETVRKPSGRTELVHHHSTDSLMDQDDEMVAQPVSVAELRSRKWVVEPNQRQKELDEERRLKQRQLRRRLARLNEQQQRRDAARLLITHIRRFREQRAERLRVTREEEANRHRMMRDLEDKIAQQRSQQRQEKRRRSISQVPHLAAAEALQLQQQGQGQEPEQQAVQPHNGSGDATDGYMGASQEEEFGDEGGVTQETLV